MRLIDADALKKAISVSHSMTDDYGIQTGYVISMKLIEDAPTIEQERKHGEWTKEEHCPFCDFAPWYEKDIHTLSYCPNCGADLRAERRTDD
jgi:rRNA maturation protein Nop10